MLSGNYENRIYEYRQPPAIIVYERRHKAHCKAIKHDRVHIYREHMHDEGQRSDRPHVCGFSDEFVYSGDYAFESFLHFSFLRFYYFLLQTAPFRDSSVALRAPPSLQGKASGVAQNDAYKIISPMYIIQHFRRLCKRYAVGNRTDEKSAFFAERYAVVYIRREFIRYFRQS